MTELRLEDVTVARGAVRLVQEASFTLKPGELVALLGPNGAGKTTLMRTALGLEKPSAGRALIDDGPSAAAPPTERARKVGYLPQIRPLAWPNRVRDVVALGRFAYGAAPGRLKAQDRDAVERALAACDLGHLRERRTDTLSGGELARVHCARAFAAEAPLLLADEPTAALDPRHQFQIMDLIARYVAAGGGALVILHDVALAARCAHRLLWMKEGRILAGGPPAETLTPERLAEVYGVKARLAEGTVIVEGAA